jgi:Spy/CpxP family protein refolding chaperone
MNRWNVKKTLIAGIAIALLPVAVLALGPQEDQRDGPFLMPLSGLPMLAAAPGMPPMGMPPMGMPPPYLRALDLTRDQRDAMFKVMHESMPAIRDLIEADIKTLDELGVLAKVDTFDAHKVRILADAHGQVRSLLLQKHAEVDAKMRAILTPVQRKKLDAGRADMGSMAAMRPF